jgi:murein L,D-transpeptidase YcbB/YkuD
MRRSWLILFMTIITGFLSFLISCHSAPPKTDVTANVQSLNDHIVKDINLLTAFFSSNHHKILLNGKDSVTIYQAAAVNKFYEERNYKALWSDTGILFPQADTMLQIIHQAADEGLLSEWYHGPELFRLCRQLQADSDARLDAMKWSNADILLTDAFMRLSNNLYFGVLPPDSISLKKETAFPDHLLINMLSDAFMQRRLKSTIDSLEPGNVQYHYLSMALASYRKENSYHHWDALPLRYTDSAQFDMQLTQRLVNGGELDSSSSHSPQEIKEALKEFQRDHALFPDGIAGAQTIAALNLSKKYRMKQIAVNLERWRHLSHNMPEEYIWVNIPSYSLTLWNDDTAIIRSRVITGKPGHQTPLLNSSIINFQLYPYWRVPVSIVIKEIKPKVLKDTGYLRKNNFEIVDRHNNIVDPKKLKWKEYNIHYFPYVIRQMTGLDNSLGIIKFNFRNKYSVYLHDTNQRDLFSLTNRDLSHGCVRVQEWKPLVTYLIRNDTLRHLPDSVQVWLAGQKQKYVALNKGIPLYIRYFTCQADSSGKIRFYPDIYGYDTVMMKNMFHE